MELDDVEPSSSTIEQYIQSCYDSSRTSIWDDGDAKRLIELLNRRVVWTTGEFILGAEPDTGPRLDWGQSLSLVVAQAYSRRLASSRKIHHSPARGLGLAAKGPCGRTFRKGDGVYRCRDCGLDDTCVLCSDCFKHSTHDGHNTFFAISSGSGGCCDCGDQEAWKVLPNCSRHAGGAILRSQSSILSDNDPQVWRAREGLRGFLGQLARLVVQTFENAAPIKRPPQSVRQFVQELSQARSPAELAEIYAQRKWLVVLWNDEKHSFETVIEKVKDAAGCHDTAGRRIAEIVDAHGREVVEVYESLETACHVASQISQIDLMTTVNDARQVFKEEAAGTILSWLVDACSCAVAGDPTLLRQILTQCLMEPSSEIRKGTEKWNLLQALMLYDVRLWKQARSDVRDLFIRLLSSTAEARDTISCCYVQAYPIMINTLIYNDREPENSFVQLSVQIFTVPSVVSCLLTKHDILGMVLRGLTIYFMSDATDFARRSAENWEEITQPFSRPLDVGSAAFKHKRYLQLLQDLKYLIANPSTASALRAAPHRVGELAHFLQNFHLVAPTTRAAHQHVEWETDIWVTAFTINFQLMRIEGFAVEAFRQSNAVTLRKACDEVVQLLLQRRDSNFTTVVIPDHLLGGRANSHLRVVSFKVSSQPCSFHHPLHRLLGGLLACVPCLAEGECGSIISSIGQKDDEVLAEIFDEPLRTVVLMAQIRCGLWVRNGLALRQQHLHYYDALQRDFTQDLDNFLLQCMMTCLDSELFLATVLHRFEILEILHDEEVAQYDAVQTDQMLEELILVLIQCLNEKAIMDGWSNDEQLRRHIRQWLALGPTTFSDLSRKVSERIADHVNFDRALNALALYKPPLGHQESGTYQLRQEEFMRVDPLFSHYSRNQREEVEKICFEKRAHTGQTPFFLSNPTAYAQNDFREGVKRLLSSRILSAIILACLKRSVLSRPETCGALLDNTLNLIAVAFVNSQDQNLLNLSELQNFYGVNWSSLVASAVTNSNLSKVCTAKASWILGRAQAAGMLDVDLLKVETNHDAHRQERQTKMRAQAIARKQALLRQFADAQRDFASQLHDSDLSDDEMGSATSSGLVPTATCIVCQEALGDSAKHAVLALVQSSGLLNTTVCEVADALGASDNESIPHRNSRRIACQGLHASSCGHSIHLHCAASFENTVDERIIMQFSRNHAEDPRTHKFTCPLCKSVYNVLLPAFSTEDPQPQKDGSHRNVMARIQHVLNQISMPFGEQLSHNGLEDVVYYTLASFSVLHPKVDLASGHYHGNIATSAEILRRMWGLRRLPQESATLPQDIAQVVTQYEASTTTKEFTNLAVTFAKAEPLRIAVWLLWRCQFRTSVDRLLRHLFSADLSRLFFLHHKEFDANRLPEESWTNVDSAPQWMHRSISAALISTLRNLSLTLGKNCFMTLLGDEEHFRSLASRTELLIARWKTFESLVRQAGNAEAMPSNGSTGLHDLGEEICGGIALCLISWTKEIKLAPDQILVPQKPTLVKLPDELEVLFERTLQIRCDHCNKIPNDPAICLTCGQLLCSQSFCCMKDGQGECNLHMARCGFASGIFMLPKKSVVVLLHEGKGTFMPAPYLDTHGEADIGFRRGRPQHLHSARYADLLDIWQKQSIPNVVARKLDAIYDTGGWETL